MKQHLITISIMALSITCIAQKNNKPKVKTQLPEITKTLPKPIKSSTITINNSKTIKFRDNKTYTIKGQTIGSYFEYEESKPRKQITFFYLLNGNKVTVTKLTDWVAQKTMDELKVYEFNTSDLNADNFGDITTNEPNESQKDTTYNLSMVAQEDKAINYDVYSIWEMKPEKRSFSYFTIECTKKEIIEKMIAEIKKTFPKKAEE